ncbi:helix-turn-helix transcriptional regulator [Mesorhizobium sp. BAC0120]|uniref:helix-turn-helix transcriptional regulator n=1 Tax=Mesorhizobium sp. BAC0120 TaxID=3090670 RepID=UPI00298C8EFB|nr:helix-turn-helix transcriptional regulator [Mesorhizobium sp. BAC0120]MDW6026206.1 helix-turn-helix transcriptional regulator [Mesorhizobium sp. BAC0120]
MMVMTDHSSDESRRRELGAFLRSRRERLSPSVLGIGLGPRRRTPGLRREEVAMAAGVGTTWYTWLEQGREVRPSAEVLSALSQALRLDAAEKRHLFILAGRQLPERPASAQEKVEGPLLHMLNSLSMQPAYVVGRRWDVLAWNSAAAAVFGDYGALDGDTRNIVHMVFTSPSHRHLLVDWEEVARVVLAQFRAESAKYIGDPDFERLVALLMQSSPEFSAWWPQRDVLRRLSGVKHIRHPTAGKMAFEHMSFSIDDGSDMRLIVYTPLAQENTIAKLAGLLETAPAHRKSA